MNKFYNVFLNKLIEPKFLNLNSKDLYVLSSKC